MFEMEIVYFLFVLNYFKRLLNIYYILKNVKKFLRMLIVLNFKIYFYKYLGEIKI